LGQFLHTVLSLKTRIKKKTTKNSNVIFLQCILLSFTIKFYWYLERCSIILLHRCHLLHLCMLISYNEFAQYWKWRCKTLLLIVLWKFILQTYFQKFYSYNFLFEIRINCSIKFHIRLKFHWLNLFTYIYAVLQCFKQDFMETLHTSCPEKV